MIAARPHERAQHHSLQREGMPSSPETLLQVDKLRVAFPLGSSLADAVSDVSFSIGKGEAVGLLGESGSGKSMTALAIMGLVPPTGRIVGGSIVFDGRNLLGMSEEEMRSVRGSRISIVFQDPLSALNPSLRIGQQLMHIIRAHGRESMQEAQRRALEVLDLVGLPDPTRVMKSYPHELSGGMRQRALIGMAIACRPQLLIADEPTTALDVTIQAQIVDLFRQLRRELDLTLIFITHNLDLMAEICDRAIVMYGGTIVESGVVEDLFSRPQHPYTNMLIDCLPRLDDLHRDLTLIPGMPPALGAIAAGCPFEPRCPRAIDRCRAVRPALESRSGHMVACWESPV